MPATEPISETQRTDHPGDDHWIQTHISRVLVRGDDVFKLKKSVDLGFLDFTTLEKRRQACEAEVELNRRLAPDVYLGVVPVTRGPDDRLTFQTPGTAPHSDQPPDDWAVHMRRLPEADRADVRLREGRLRPADLRRIAQNLAAFHARARCDEHTTRYGMVETIRANVEENFSQTPSIHEYLTPAQVAEIETWQRDFLDRHSDLFAARRQAKRVRDGHGDLRLEHVYLNVANEIRIVDCIEFNERFRFGDVCADIAFLAMDLTWSGHGELAETFLASYARAANDFDLYQLIDFYESYRAFVRGKIATFLATDPKLDRRRREQIRADARRFFLLALSASRRSLVPPRLIAVGGWIASGKSTVAEHLAECLHAPIVDTDRTRKHLLRVAEEAPVHEAPWAGAYSEDMGEQVYAEVLRRAEITLRSGRSVILDASFRSRHHRALARQLADRCEAAFHFIECRSRRDLCLERLRQRALKRSVSDGRLEIFDAFIERYEPVDELPEDRVVHLDTTSELPACYRTLQRRLPWIANSPLENCQQT